MEDDIVKVTFFPDRVEEWVQVGPTGIPRTEPKPRERIVEYWARATVGPTGITQFKALATISKL